MRRHVSVFAAAAALAAALSVVGCGSSDPAASGTTGSASAGDPPIVLETDAQLTDAVVAMSTVPTVLDPRIWDGDAMKPGIRAKVLANVNGLADRLGIPDLTIDGVDLVGSNASYEYDNKADFGVHVFVSSPTTSEARLAPMLKLLSGYTELKQEGQITYWGVPLEVVFHGPRTANYAPRKGIGQYSISDGTWMEKPTAQPDRFNRDTMATDARRFITAYNALVEEYAKDAKAFRCSRFGDLDDEMKTYRNAGINRDGSRSTENLAYRTLRRLGVNIPDMVDELEERCEEIQASLP